MKFRMMWPGEKKTFSRCWKKRTVSSKFYTH
jgi:hypothetical protein